MKLDSLLPGELISYKLDKSYKRVYIIPMLNNSVSIDDLRTNLAELIGRVMYGNNRVIIKKYNRDAAVLLSVDDYEKLLDPTKRLSKSQWDEEVRKLDSIRTNIPNVDPKDIVKEISQVVRDVRAENKNQNA